MPDYPADAADHGIEGWVLVQFTVDAAGLVVPSSVSVVDEEPPRVFTHASIDSLNTFTFNPRIDDGVAVPVHNVKYVFRWELDETG